MTPGINETLRNLFAKIRYALAKNFKSFILFIRFEEKNWKWTAYAVIILLLTLYAGAVVDLLPDAGPVAALLIIFFYLVIPLLSAAFFRQLIHWLDALPRKWAWALFAPVFFIIILFGGPDESLMLVILFLLLPPLFIGASAASIFGGSWKKLSHLKRNVNIFFMTIGLAALVFAVWFLAYPGPEPEERHPFAMDAGLLPPVLTQNDPSKPGMYSWSTFTYGSGKDKHRVEYGDSADLITPTVDGSKLIDGWEGFTGKMRSKYWNAGPDSLPLNGRVWMPEGSGPFPLILMVHGNHLDRDYSDPGYAYLGEQFASLGIIAVSVDENFLNSAWFNFRKGLKSENDARGWLLLKHLEQWRSWNSDSSSVLYNKADLNSVVLVGHSRGGEAVNVAAFFNTLPCDPDNGLETFDFNFGIKGLISIAQVDGQYSPANIGTPVSNVNFLALQGSFDSDMQSYHGLRQLNRVNFTDSLFHFKTGIYIYGANHGQFNTSWGLYDGGYPVKLIYNRRSIIPAADQEKIALVYMSAFVRTTLLNDPSLLNLFRDYRYGREWLPETVYLNQYLESSENILCNFEEDLDLTSGSSHVDSISAANFTSWKEEKVSLKWGSQESRAVVLGWNNSDDSISAEYSIYLNTSESFLQDTNPALVFWIADYNQDPGTHAKKDSTELETGSSESSLNSLSTDNPEANTLSTDKKDRKKEEKDEKEEAINFSIVLCNEESSLTLHSSDFMPLQPQIGSKIYKATMFEKNADKEMVPQYFRIDLGSLPDSTGQMKPASVKVIRFVFDQTEKGMIMLDNIGFAK